MTESLPVSAQTVASLSRENTKLIKVLNELYQENLALKQQVFQLSGVLSVAVTKLHSLGIALEPPFDLRAARREHSSHEFVWSSDAKSMGDASEQRGADADADASPRKLKLSMELKDFSKAIQCAAFSPDETSLIASGGLDCRLTLSNFKNGNKVHSFDAHEQNISDLAWVKPGCLVSGSFDGLVKLWDIASTKAALGTLQGQGFILSAVAVDQNMVFCSDSKRWTHLWDIRTSKPLSWEHMSRVNSVAGDASQTKLVTGHNDGVVSFWDMRLLTPTSGKSLEAVTPTAAGSTTTPFRGTATPGTSGSPHLSGSWQNDASQSSICSISHYRCRDDTKRLLVVSTDSMLRVYRNPSLQDVSQEAVEDYGLHNVISGVQSRSAVVRASFWQGKRAQRSRSPIFDEERDDDPLLRTICECDIIVTGGPETSAIVCDVTDGGGALTIQRLEGHKGRVSGSAVHHSESKPIFATYSDDATIRIWVPAKN